VGTTRFTKFPKWARTAGTKQIGLSPYDNSGFSIVKQKDSYLLALAVYHDERHKHRDELSFSWLEAGSRIITDSGHYSYRSEKAEGRYATSTRAHNTLMVDNEDFDLKRPYGSGMRATGDKDGWYAIIGHNPLLARKQVAHERLWVYRPGQWLVVVDRVGSPKEHTHDRFFHFWHERKVALSDDGLATVEFDKGSVYARDFSSQKVEAKLLENEKNPLQGVMFTNGKKPRPNAVLQLTGKGDKVVYGMAFRVGQELPKKMSVSYDRNRGYQVELGDDTMTLRRAKDRVLFNAKPLDEGKPASSADPKAQPSGGQAKKPAPPAAETPAAKPAAVKAPAAKPSAP
jgi:hypothetical protein